MSCRPSSEDQPTTTRKPRSSDDVDLDPDDIRLPDGTRLTQEVAEAIVEDVRRRAGRPSLTGQSEVPPGVSFRLTPDVREQGRRDRRTRRQDALCATHRSI
jgi:hypothetical protein